MKNILKELMVDYQCLIEGHRINENMETAILVGVVVHI
jgi:hypothetical protein